jgi:hypothetical protein
LKPKPKPQKIDLSNFQNSNPTRTQTQAQQLFSDNSFHSTKAQSQYKKASLQLQTQTRKIETHVMTDSVTEVKDVVKVFYQDAS